jgi:hypothetical protein
MRRAWTAAVTPADVPTRGVMDSVHPRDIGVGTREPSMVDDEESDGDED